MMHSLYYKTLKDITQIQKPYRGTYNRFPIGKRSQSYKYFLAEQENGETVYRVKYGAFTDYTEITKDLYEQLKGKINVRVAQRGDPKSPRYFLLETQSRDICTVRPDNTFEFTAKYLGQGENDALTKWSFGIYRQSVRHGGTIYEGRSNFEDRGAFHPIWLGARFNMVNMKPHTPYQVFGLSVNRKLAKDYFKSYENFFKVAKAMSSAMEWGNFKTTATDVINEHIPDYKYIGIFGGMQDFLDKARELQDTAPLDAYILYACGLNPYLVNTIKQDRFTTMDTKEIYARFHRQLTKHIYSTTPELFKATEYEAGKRYPANNWGIKVFVDDKQVEQY
jgi:hypothetical protein